MKPYEIYKLWALFDKATNDPSFNAEQKYSVGMDMLSDLPPEMLCSSSKPSLSVVREAMVGRLTEIDNERRKSKAGLRTGTPPVACTGGPNEGPKEGDGVSVESLVAPENKQGRSGKGSSKK